MCFVALFYQELIRESRFCSLSSLYRREKSPSKLGRSKIPLIGNFLFETYEMNKRVKRKFGSKRQFYAQNPLRQPGFITNNKDRIQKFKETGDYIRARENLRLVQSVLWKF